MLTEDVYFDKARGAWQASLVAHDVTGDPSANSVHHMPVYRTVSAIAACTQALAEQAIAEAGGRIEGGRYLIPTALPSRGVAQP